MKLSFVIPTYNSAEYIHPAIESCLTQTHDDVEVVVVDDASTDSTHDYLTWLEKLGHKNLRIVRNPKNLGRSAARNIGNNMATGDIIAVCDADDLSAPKRAELTVAKFKAGAQFVHGGAHMMDPVGRDGGMVPTDVFNWEQSIERLSVGMVHSTIAYSKSLANMFPYLDGEPARLGVDDFCLVMSLAAEGVKFDYIPSPIAAYRVNENGITAKRDNAEVIEFKRKFVEGLKVAA